MVKKLVYENLFEFNKGNNPLNTLGIGREASIIKFFNYLNIPESKYTITDEKIHFHFSLNLEGYHEITKLPDGLNVGQDLYLDGTSITQLPERLYVYNDLDLMNTLIIDIPVDLEVDGRICVLTTQTELIKNIENSNLKDKLVIYEQN